MNLSSTIEIYCKAYKLHYRTMYQGLPISVENRKGSVRKGCDPKWGCWHTRMKFPYGYIRGTKGNDGDEVDCYIGPNDSAKMAYVIHIRKQPSFKQFDEDKIFLGFNSKVEAKKAFLAHYDDSRFYGGMDVIPMEEFKKKVLNTTGKLEAEIGEPGTYSGGYGHIDPTPSFHPPSLKKPQKVPADNPDEKDDRFLDVTKRKSKDTQKFRMEQIRRTSEPQSLGGYPTAIQHHTG